MIENLKAMGSYIKYSLAVRILVASIEVPKMLPVTAPTKTLLDEHINWESDFTFF